MTRKDYLVIYTLLLYSITMFGTGSSIFGLSIIEFADNMKVSIEEISFGMFLSGFTGCLGSLIATFSLDKWNRQIQLALCNGLLSIVFILYPFFTSLIYYFINQSINGFLIPFLNTIPNIWVVEMFGKSSKTYLQIMHFFFPIGQMFGPLIILPFLKNLNSTSTISTTEYYEDDLSFFESLFKTTKNSQLWIPYLIIGCMKLSISVLIIAAFFIKPYKKPTEKEVDKTKSNNQEQNFTEERKQNISKGYLVLFTFLICLVTGIQLANESNAITYLPTYLIKSEIKLSQKTAAYCQAMLSTSMTVGRFVNVLLTMIISTETMIFINFFFIIFGNFLIITLGNYFLTWVYVGCIILGYGFSNAFPMMIAFVEERVKLTNKTMSLMNFSATLALVACQISIGKFLDSNPSKFIILNLSITAFALIVFILLICLEGLRLSKKLCF